jgi:hypothetical protein
MLSGVFSPVAANFVSEDQLTVNAVLLPLSGPIPISQAYTYMLINRSAGGQIIRTGFAPNFVPNRGISLLVNEVVIYEDVDFIVSAISSGAGGLLDTFVSWRGLI